jgi:hypothetical protein
MPKMNLDRQYAGLLEGQRQFFNTRQSRDLSFRKTQLKN